MNQSESTKLLNQLLQQDVSEVQIWLRRVWGGQLKAPENFNWLGLAEAAAFNARSGHDDDSTAPDVSWAEIATSVYDWLAAKASPGTGESFMNSSMLLRAATIAQLGSIPGHPVLDIDQIIHWFFNSLKMSYEEAVQKATNWRSSNLDDIRKLRQIKNQLKVISVLTESKDVILNQELIAWLNLREKLP